MTDIKKVLPVVNWSLLTEELINKYYQDLQHDIDTKIKNTLDVKNNRTWNNTMSLWTCDFNTLIKNMYVKGPRNFHDNKNIRDNSFNYHAKLRNKFIDIYSNVDMYKTVKDYADNVKEELTHDQQQVIKQVLFNFKMNGVTLDESSRKQVSTILKKIQDLRKQYEQNIAEYDKELLFNKKELTGLNNDIINRKDRNKYVKLSTQKYKEIKTNEYKQVINDTYQLLDDDNTYYGFSLKYPDYKSIMDYVESPKVRKQMYEEFHNKCVNTNIKIIHQIVEYKQQLSKLFNTNTFSDYILESTIAKTPDNISQFLNDLLRDLQSLVNYEYDEFLKIKKEMKLGDKLDIYDTRFFDILYKNNIAQIDMKIIKHWFPFEIVIEGVMKVYSQLLSLEFKENKQTSVWHETVKFYEVYDSKTNELLGGIYLDLFPRLGKYNHACCRTLTERTIDNGTMYVPLALILCNFTPSSTLEFEEVVMYFHEFGHGMHAICDQTTYSILSSLGPHITTDFIECPSQMFEFWCTEKEVLDLMTSYTLDDGKYIKGSTIPTDLIEKIKIVQKLGKGWTIIRQIALSLMDIELHTTQNTPNTYDIYKNVIKKVTGFDIIEGTNIFACFIHLVDDYDSRYYSYLWSLVYATDMYHTKFKNKCLDKTTGMELRNKVFAYGASKNPMLLINDFLGRDPSITSLKDYFLSSASTFASARPTLF
jgi:Zn-dependent oligopeptidase